MKRRALLCALVAALLMHGHVALAHGPEMLLGSTANGSGALTLDYDFTTKTVVSELQTLGQVTLYISQFPGFEWIQASDPGQPPYALTVGTPFSLQIVSIDAGASVIIGSKTLNAAGQSAFVANTTAVLGDHFHPQWQLILPTGTTGNYTVSFKVTTTSHSYTASAVYALTLTNIQEPTPIPSQTTGPTMTPSAAAATDTRTGTSTPVATGSMTATATLTSTATPTFTAESTRTPSATTAATQSPTTTPTGTSAPSATAVETPTPSSTPSPTGTPTVAPPLGDANCDSRVSVADLPAEIDLLAADASVRCGADLNDNSMVDPSDLSLLIEVLFQP